jgi:fido (protein-threonine AMPylation protein)/DNA-binding transcriptional ArsR family regulator
VPEITYDRAETAGYQERFDNWKTAIGLQAVDRLSPSEYLTTLAQDHIEGTKTIDEVERLVEGYYAKLENHQAAEQTRQDEADLVSARIAKLLETKTFALTENSLRAIHKKLFSGFRGYTPGIYRSYDIVKSEWVLDGDTVQYGHWQTLDDEIALLVNQEQCFDYSKLAVADKVSHIADFTSELWVQHAFLEGNTRTTALFIIKYLRSIGVVLDNQPFESNSWYFRNALARANYRNAAIGITADDSYLQRFFDNLLLGKHHELKNRTIHIYWQQETAAAAADPVNDPVNDPVTKTLNTTASAVLRCLQNNPHATYDNLAAATGVSRATIRRVIRILKDTGAITRIGSDKSGHWSINDRPLR